MPNPTLHYSWIGPPPDINACFELKDVIQLSPLHQAILTDNEGAIKLLMQNGANLDVKATFNNFEFRGEMISGFYTPLELAQRIGRDNSLPLLQTPVKKVELPAAEDMQTRSVRQLRDDYQKKILDMQERDSSLKEKHSNNNGFKRE